MRIDGLDGFHQVYSIASDLQSLTGAERLQFSHLQWLWHLEILKIRN